jgi:hypothetical protein
MNASIWSDMLYLTLPVVEKVVQAGPLRRNGICMSASPGRLLLAATLFTPARSGRQRVNGVWFSPTGRSVGHRDCCGGAADFVADPTSKKGALPRRQPHSRRSELLRTGMGGQPRCTGPSGPQIYDAVYQAGQRFGIERRPSGGFRRCCGTRSENVIWEMDPIARGFSLLAVETS